MCDYAANQRRIYTGAKGAAAQGPALQGGPALLEHTLSYIMNLSQMKKKLKRKIKLLMTNCNCKDQSPKSCVLNITLHFKLKSFYKIMSIFLQSRPCSQAIIQRGRRGRAPFPRKVSLHYWCSFWNIFSAKYPKFSRLASLAGLFSFLFPPIISWPNMENFRGSLRSPERVRG